MIAAALYIINYDGSGLRAPAARASTGWPARLVTRRQNDPLQNPSRRRLQRHRRQPLHDPPRRNQLHQLTHLPSYSRVLDGSYSPDGTSIVFETSNQAIGGAHPTSS